MRSRFILTFDSGESDGDILRRLEERGLEVDRAYGLIKLDLSGRQWVTRVVASEEDVRLAQGHLEFSYVPDMPVFDRSDPPEEQ